MAVVGGIIGGGIFTPATVAERLRSPGLVLLAWVIGGVVALIGAFCFGELGQRRRRRWRLCVPARDVRSAAGIPLRLDAVLVIGHRGASRGRPSVRRLLACAV